MRLQILLTIVCLTIRIDSQSLTRTSNSNEPGSGQLYFEDNLPRSNNIKNVNLNSDDAKASIQQAQAQSGQQNLRNGNKQDDIFKTVNKPVTQNGNLQNQYQTINQNDNLQSQANNLQNQYNYLNLPVNQNNEQNQNQFNPNLSQNSNYQFQQSLGLAPPSQSSQDYYTKQSLTHSNIGAGADNRYATRADPVPLSQNTRQVNLTNDMKLASAVISHIGIFMMKSARGNQSNIVVSPVSVVNMLALLQAGATGATQEQVTNALRLSPEKSAEAFRLMNTEFRKRGDERNILRSASSIFASDSFELSRDFKNFAIQNFGSEVSRISFDNPNAAVQKINSWIASKTNNQINKLVSPDSIGVNTQLVLANAIYFKGIWETMFQRSETSLQDFNLSNGGKKSVSFMTLRSGFRAGLDKANKAIVIVLPFENNEYSLVMLLPVAGADVSAVLASLDGETLANYQNLRRQDVLLEIPKFSVRSNADLQPIFTKMGITRMFSPTSELSHIGLYRATSPQVSSAVHSAMMSIDEQGATAAASTVVAVVALSFDNPSVVFRADRPFLAVLWDNQLSVPLFMTKIEDPSL
ncbi:serine protease inhibitor 42Dd-like [Leguminivora glycinivorella]|uniref:serine protease inhibitor 42Dd-like n=1 Tax=Leguminivora glycinivorella TaxID=1035111 RepID=UPI00200CB34C|nr:serine protease inhibitor 42Dd-like [Leguminivora glycinivorella]